MDTTMTQHRNRMQSSTSTTNSSSASGSINVASPINSSNNGQGSTSAIISQSPPAIERSTSSFANLLDGFTSRVSGDRQSQSAASTPSSSSSSAVLPMIGGGGGAPISTASLVSGALGGASSIASLTSIGSTANAFYSSIGLALNSLTSPITAAAAAASATTAEVVVAAASAISNHLSSPTSTTPPHGELDDDDDCDEDDDEEDDGEDGNIPAPTPRKTWSEIKATVNEIRKQMSNLSSMVPSSIQFRTLSDGRVRCYFLSTPPNAWEPTLLYTDINLSNMPSTNNSDDLASPDSPNDSGSIRMGSPPPSHASSPTMQSGFLGGFGNSAKRLRWNVVLQQPMSIAAATAGASGLNVWAREFQLMQERKRLSTWGITSYELHKPSGKIVFPCLNDLYQCLDTGYNNSPLFPIQLRTCPQWAALDPQICPQNSDLIAYISGCDIWVTHTLSGHEERLTFAHDGRRTFADDPLSAGLPSYVMQEEFSRYQGYWWQPHSDDGIYRIVYEEVDESDVCLYTFPSAHAAPGEMEEYRFPRTGTPNAKSKLKMVQFVLNESLQISDVCIKDLPYSLSVVLPWLEYIVRVGWTMDSKYVWMAGMDRKQQRMDLLLIPVDNFCETYSSSTSSPSGSTDHSWKSPFCRTVSPLQVIYTQISESWINVHDLLHFLEITDTTVTFLWASEETGFRHLYLVTSSLCAKTLNGCNDPVLNSSAGSAFDNSQRLKFHGATNSSDNHAADIMDSATLHPRIINKVALTSGEWEVLGRNLWVDKEKQLVYFLGLRETPLEKHLYVVSLQRPEHIRQLTEPGYSYMVEFDESCQLMLQVYCNIQRLPSCKVMRLVQTCQNGGVNGIHLSLMGYLHEGGKPEPQYCPQIYSPQLPSGEIVYAMVFKPHNFQLGVKYPTVLNVYGGPEVQTVNNTFKGKHQLRMHMLAAQGYCVICIDSRGSRHRGIKFESHIRCRMGQVELNDQVDALKILADQLGYIDMNRVGIHGWSYGGYLSLMGLVHYPNIFKVAIAGAPVTNWEYYDTGYTERYMDLPQNNKHGYTAGSVLNYIHSFPEEDNRLLLIHGLIDENVHFFHTSQLINALNKANKPYTLHIFPDERHSLRNLESNKNYETKLLSFLQNL
ncbi:dipeptidyl peptidase 9 [Stomoxys calcitrans]|uniref:Dipeptidyl peptidase 9 n=1 Tax=Stomoxys calcitrans TaxID=35570 RepID=A0A1I8PEU9_STOCA|nr:dipeptidyl peptidase 9 [Stomoxys calcitrans]